MAIIYDPITKQWINVSDTQAEMGYDRQGLFPQNLSPLLQQLLQIGAPDPSLEPAPQFGPAGGQASIGPDPIQQFQQFLQSPRYQGLSKPEQAMSRGANVLNIEQDMGQNQAAVEQYKQEQMAMEAMKAKNQMELLKVTQPAAIKAQGDFENTKIQEDTKRRAKEIDLLVAQGGNEREIQKQMMLDIRELSKPNSITGKVDSEGLKLYLDHVNSSIERKSDQSVFNPKDIVDPELAAAKTPEQKQKIIGKIQANMKKFENDPVKLEQAKQMLAYAQSKLVSVPEQTKAKGEQKTIDVGGFKLKEKKSALEPIGKTLDYVAPLFEHDTPDSLIRMADQLRSQKKEFQADPTPIVQYIYEAYDADAAQIVADHFNIQPNRQPESSYLPSRTSKSAFPPMATSGMGEVQRFGQPEPLPKRERIADADLNDVERLIREITQRSVKGASVSEILKLILDSVSKTDPAFIEELKRRGLTLEGVS